MEIKVTIKENQQFVNVEEVVEKVNEVMGNHGMNNPFKDLMLDFEMEKSVQEKRRKAYRKELYKIQCELIEQLSQVLPLYREIIKLYTKCSCGNTTPRQGEVDKFKFFYGCIEIYKGNYTFIIRQDKVCIQYFRRYTHKYEIREIGENTFELNRMKEVNDLIEYVIKFYKEMENYVKESYPIWKNNYIEYHIND